MKTLFNLIFSLFFVINAQAQQKSPTKKPTISQQEVGATLEETLQWLKSKIERYYQQSLSFQTFEYNLNYYTITITQRFNFTSEHNKSCTCGGWSRNEELRTSGMQRIRNVTRTIVFDFRNIKEIGDLQNEKWSLASETIELATYSDCPMPSCREKTVKGFRLKSTFKAFQIYTDYEFQSPDTDLKYEPHNGNANVSSVVISLQDEEENILQRIFNAFKHAIEIAPTKQTNEKF